MFRITDSYRKLTFITRNISFCRPLQCEEKKPKRKVKETVELVTLVDQDDKILGLKPKPETEKLARKHNLSLVRVYDTKFGKVYPAYKLVSSADLLKQEKKTSNAKVLKKLPLNSRISDHDLTTKIKTIQRWISKNCEVHVAITSGNNESQDLRKTVFEKLQNELKNECRIIDVRQKEDALKCIIIPPKVPPMHKSPPENDKNIKTATQQNE